MRRLALTRTLTLTLTLTLALALATPALAQHEWRPVDATTGQVRDVEGLEQLARDFPDSGNVRLRMLQPLLEAGETEKLLGVLGWLKERGYVFGDVPQQQIPKLVGEGYAEAAAALLLPEAEVIEASEVVATVPADAGLIESVARADHSGTLAVTSISENGIYVSDPAGDWEEIPIPEGNDPSGMVADPANKTIWVSLGNVDGSDDGPDKFSGLIGFFEDMDRSRLISAPEGAVPSDITMAGDGTLFASDPISGGIYRSVKGSESLAVVLEPGTLRSPQGLATSADGKLLYVSDYRYGIAIVELATRRVTRLASEIPVILDGVDGLWRYGNELIAVQNGTSPMRISAFELSEDGERVVGHRILEQSHSGWTEPLGGSIDGDALIYVATGQWDRYVDGKLADGKDASPTQIRSLPLQKGD